MRSSDIIRGLFGPLTLVICSLTLPCARGSGSGNVGTGAPILTHLSPGAHEVAPQDAWRLAELFAANRSDCEVVVGRGDSMLPLYRDRTVLVLEHMDMSALRPGMTVVFVGDSGRPVAHTLVEKTVRGWRAAGVASGKRDQTFIQSRNYIGTVIRAYSPNRSIPTLAAQRMPASDAAIFASVAGDQ